MEPNVLNEGYTKFIHKKEDIQKVKILTDRFGITKHSDSISEKKEHKILKFITKTYFLASIALILIITFSFIVVQFGEDWGFVQNMSFVTFDQLQTLYSYALRILAFSLGLSIFISVVVYAREEEINYTSRTAMIIVIINLAYLVAIVFVLKKILRKQGKTLGVIGGVI